MKESEAWRGIRDIHTSFHHGAAEVLTLALGGRREDAKALLSGEFTDRADRMLKALSLWKLDMKTTASGASDRAET
ncbi:hypothetical protein RGUI_0800 [Rhodovulum sp. P5]|uniref:hypothetical protein n=1 Tax=Rhodovulum sp. P5 TaxID=1564506 RepID=UPI0009C2E002|nr:hypothetical protein [Rhodovulum sp. P5]ARE38941.1 hypothetical protein RGUI_0800 [Rhodovulum sp. P5]